MHDEERYRERSRQGWDAVAPAWERWRERLWEVSAPVSRWLVERAAPKPGDTVLDLAAGAGDTGLLLAERLEGRGHAILVDVSPAMLEAAARRAAELGLGGVVETREMDAHDLDLADDSIDAATCRFGYMLLRDPAAAMRETGRVLRPGGRVAFSVWAEPERNPWAFVIADVLTERGLAPPRGDTSEPGMFHLCDVAAIERLAGAAGMEILEVGEVPYLPRFDSFDEYWTISTEMSGMITGALDGVPAEVVAEVRAEAARRFELHDDGDGYLVPGVSRVVCARPSG